MKDFRDWLAAHWVAGALCMAVALTLLTPVLVGALATPVLLIYLHSPGYMLHQIEEHWGDRFRTYINTKLFGGIDALTTQAVLWINLPGVWGIDLAALYAARMVDPGYGLAAPYLMIVNAVAHLGMAARLKAYNPGVATSVALFFPLGFATLWLVPATLAQHALGLGISLAIHAAIVVHTARRAHVLKAA